jgi:signal transduction histidine kinase/CheY-like chemotaxis protein
MIQGNTESDAERIRTQQVLAVCANAITGAISGITGSAILAVVLTTVQKAAAGWVAAWFIALLGVHTIQILLSLYHRRHRASPYRPWAMGYTTLALTSGILWGCGVVGAAASSGIETELLVLMVSSGIAAGAGLSNGSFLPAFYARFLPTNLPYVAWSCLQGDVLHLFLALFTIAFMGGIIQLVRQYNRTIVEMIRLRFENVDLVDGLRRQTEAADLANITKSRFLAAASHDLRQPVHALNLLVGALQSRQMDDGAQHLVRQIDSSVAALDNLFGSLLDISKLDAGVVALELRNVRIHPILERICREFRTTADAKGIELGFHPCSQSIYTDPILLERVLRNLVSNAIRYTKKGRVVVGCRRNAAYVSVQVWDTGPGIPEDQQQLIFQEFYQIGNPGRDRKEGIGMGLAIVKRLSGLLACELSLSSQVGSGTAFKVAVPLARQEPLGEHVDVGTIPDAAGPNLILVIDDEVAIQAAMHSLLASWGNDVVVAGSADEMLQKIVLTAVVPNLIVCDYRLQNGENGVDAIRRLQAEYNEDIPAILITGDTAPDRLREAQESGFAILHKPVHNHELRIALNGLLRQHASR